jgi:biotin carboxyl carrier protein
LGFSSKSTKKANEIKAPMPGMVLSVLVQEGQLVKAGESVLILEAMKMENVIKAPADCTVKQIKVKQGNAVEKNQVLIELA